MEKISKVIGKALPLGYANVDTDQIAPSDTMKFSTRQDLSSYLFQDWREDPNFVLNNPAYHGAVTILAGENFGCGSSREHAPWALTDYGFKAVIAPSFGDIFKNNCSKVGILTIELSMDKIQQIIDVVEQDPDTEVVIDLESCSVRAKEVNEGFKIDEFTRQRLLKGLTDIELSLLYQEDIKKHEETRHSFYPSIN
jgi:3-isopropylmalate/(R)-2-methylmalate dehydratase small subunit